MRKRYIAETHLWKIKESRRREGDLETTPLVWHLWRKEEGRRINWVGGVSDCITVLKRPTGVHGESSKQSNPLRSPPSCRHGPVLAPLPCSVTAGHSLWEAMPQLQMSGWYQKDSSCSHLLFFFFFLFAIYSFTLQRLMRTEWTVFLIQYSICNIKILLRSFKQDKPWTIQLYLI